MYNNLVPNIQNSLTSALSEVIGNFLLFLPTMLGSLVVFLIGVVLSRWVKTVLIKVLDLVRLSQWFGSGAVKQFLANAQVSEKIEYTIGEVARYLVLLVFFVASVNLLGLHTVTLVLNSLLAYIPNIFAAIIILVAGTILAGFVEKLVKGSLGSLDLKLSRIMGKFSSYLTVIFATLAAFSQLGIARNLIDTLFVGFVSMLALALGLSLGLGSKDLVKTVLEDWYKNFKKDLK